VAVPCGFTQEATEEQKTRQDILEDILANSGEITGVNKVTTQQDPARPQALPQSSFDPETRLKYEQALRDYYEYRSDGLKHRRSVFRWQLFSAKMIFVIVLVLVSIGIIFAAIQFRRGMSGNNKQVKDKQNLETKMELGPQGIKINSPVLGVIILALSLAFFYLYLVYVYPIENIF
jgi:hypothetical protein